MLESKKTVFFELVRIASGPNSTVGVLYECVAETDIIRFLCFTLEDEYRDSKVPGKTRIPNGRYEVKLRKTGGHDERYAVKFPELHGGMLHLVDVPGFKHILVHIGNTHHDTAGCILVGSAIERDGQDFRLVRSTQAYRNIYPVIAGPLLRDNPLKVVLAIFDIEGKGG